MKTRRLLALAGLFAALLSPAPAADAAAFLTEQLARLRAELADLSQRHGEQHPSVVAQRATIADLEKRLNDLRKAPTAVPPPNLTFDFPGGTLAQLIATLAKAPGGPINIIGDPEDLKTALPAFAMQNAHPAVFARSLGQFLQSRGLSLEHAGVQISGSSDVYTLKRFQVPPARSPSRDQFEAMQLASYLEHQKVDDIVDAIRTAWQLDPAHDPQALKLKYHPATSILLVSGPGDAIDVAKKIVNDTLRRTDPDTARRQAVADEITKRRELRDKATPRSATDPAPTK